MFVSANQPNVFLTQKIWLIAKQNLIEIVKTAKTMNGFVRVDMEGSAYTEASLRLVSQAHQEIPCIGAVLQTMLRRTA